MVNFNPAEIRGFHGRWVIGGPHHPHLRHRKGLLGRAESAIGASMREASRVGRISQRDIRVTAERSARAAGISSSMFRDAERAAGVRTPRPSRAGARSRRRGSYSPYHRYRSMMYRHPMLARAMYGGRGGHLMQALYIGRLLHHPKTATTGHIGIPSPGSVPAAKKPKKPPAKKKPPTIRPPKAPSGKRTTGGKAKGAGQKVTPSAQVMANLGRYVNAPGGARAGVGTSGRSSLAMTGVRAGSRVNAGSRSGSSSGARSPAAIRARTHR